MLLNDLGQRLWQQVFVSYGFINVLNYSSTDRVRLSCDLER